MREEKLGHTRAQLRAETPVGDRGHQTGQKRPGGGGTDLAK